MGVFLKQHNIDTFLLLLEVNTINYLIKLYLTHYGHYKTTCLLKYYFSVFNKDFPTMAAAIPPSIGAIMNTHN